MIELFCVWFEYFCNAEYIMIDCVTVRVRSRVFYNQEVQYFSHPSFGGINSSPGYTDKTVIGQISFLAYSYYCL